MPDNDIFNRISSSPWRLTSKHLFANDDLNEARDRVLGICWQDLSPDSIPGFWEIAGFIQQYHAGHVSRELMLAELERVARRHACDLSNEHVEHAKSISGEQFPDGADVVTIGMYLVVRAARMRVAPALFLDRAARDENWDFHTVVAQLDRFEVSLRADDELWQRLSGESVIPGVKHGRKRMTQDEILYGLAIGR